MNNDINIDRPKIKLGDTFAIKKSIYRIIRLNESVALLPIVGVDDGRFLSNFDEDYYKTTGHMSWPNVENLFNGFGTIRFASISAKIDFEEVIELHGID